MKHDCPALWKGSSHQTKTETCKDFHHVYTCDSKYFTRKNILYRNHKVYTITAGQMCGSEVHISISIHTHRRSLLQSLNLMTILPFHLDSFTRTDSPALCEKDKMSYPLWLELPLYLISLLMNTRLISDASSETVTSSKQTHYSGLLLLTAESAEIKHTAGGVVDTSACLMSCDMMVKVCFNQKKTT